MAACALHVHGCRGLSCLHAVLLYAWTTGVIGRPMVLQLGWVGVVKLDSEWF
jgi:hypothetical protein